MNIEEALIDLGDEPLSKSPCHRLIIAVVNAYMSQSDVITRETHGDEALSRIYRDLAGDQRDEVLMKNVGHVRNRDSYKTIVLSAAGLIGVALIVVAIVTISQAGTGDSRPGIDAITNIVNQLFELIRMVIGAG